jgi:hypothetical protein
MHESQESYHSSNVTFSHVSTVQSPEHHDHDDHLGSALISPDACGVACESFVKQEAIAFDANPGLKKEISGVKLITSSSRKLQYCMIYKNGSTSWLRFLWFVQYGNFSGYSRVQAYKSLYADIDPTYLRFVIVRNPYLRVLSGFLNRIEKNLLYPEYKGSFSQFIDFLNNKSSLKEVNPHFWEQSRFCNLSSIPFHLELKAEQVQSWFGCLTHIFGDAGMQLCNGWETDSGCFIEGNFSGSRCQSCASKNIHGLDLCSAAVCTNPSDGKLFSTNSENTMQNISLITKDIAIKICNIYKTDFEKFGYPCWDGESRFPLF